MLKYYLIKLSKIVSLFFTVFRIKRNRVLFYSFSGKACSDSPYYLADYLSQNNSKYEIIWAVNNPSKWMYLESRGWKLIKYHSIKHFFYGMTAGFIITNTGPYKALQTRKEQKIINTWHGGGAYKKTGMDNPYKDKYQYLYNKNYAQSGVTLFLSSSNAFTKYVIKGAFGYSGDIFNCGLPRNDVLLDPQKHEEIREKVKKTINIKRDEHFVLFAPTWRNYEINDYEKIDVEKVISACQDRFGGSWKFVFRGHNLSRGITLSKTSSFYDATDYPDMQELLITADILISDYSSCIWDYSLLYKPCFLFTPDLKEYDSTFAFYTPIIKWGFPVCQDNQMLCNSIREFCYELYQEGVKENHQYFGCCETGAACKAVYEYMLTNERR